MEVTVLSPGRASTPSSKTRRARTPTSKVRSRIRKNKAERPPSPRENLSGHYDIWEYKSNGRGRKKKPRIGFCGAIIFFTLCLAAVVLTVQFNTGEWRTMMTIEGKVRVGELQVEYVFCTVYSIVYLFN